MRRSTAAIVTLSIVLVGSNLWWGDRQYRYSHALEVAGFEYRAERAGSVAARRLLPAVVRSDMSKTDFLAIARRLDPNAQPHDSAGNSVDNSAWIGPLVFRFDSSGKLLEVAQQSAGFVD